MPHRNRHSRLHEPMKSLPDRMINSGEYPTLKREVYIDGGYKLIFLGGPWIWPCTGQLGVLVCFEAYIMQACGT